MLKKFFFYAFIMLFKTDSKKGHGIQLLVISIYIIIFAIISSFNLIRITNIKQAKALQTGYISWENDRGITVYKKSITYCDYNKLYYQAFLEEEFIAPKTSDFGKVYTIFYNEGQNTSISLSKKDLIRYDYLNKIIVLYIVASLLFIIGIILICRNKDDHVFWEFHPFDGRKGHPF